MNNTTPLELALAEINAGIIRCQQEELRYRVSGFYEGAETEKEKRLELERIKKDIEALKSVEKEHFESCYDSGVKMGESKIPNFGYESFISSEQWFDSYFKYK